MGLVIPWAGLAAGICGFVVLACLWFGRPLLLRARH
jgi:hypothetical protein